MISIIPTYNLEVLKHAVDRLPPSVLGAWTVPKAAALSIKQIYFSLTPSRPRSKEQKRSLLWVGGFFYALFQSSLLRSRQPTDSEAQRAREKERGEREAFGRGRPY